MGPGVVFWAVAVWIKGLMHTNKVMMAMDFFIVLTLPVDKIHAILHTKSRGYTT